MSRDRILIVEGTSDQYLFEEILRTLNVIVEVRVTSPKDHGGSYNTKGGVFTTLPLLIRQLNDGRLSRVAAVVDADHKSNNGMGFSETLKQITALLNLEGFIKRERVGENGGYCFHHNDGLNPIGIWIMPDNSADGGVEEWALSSVIADEVSAIEYAKQIFSKVPGGTKFGATHQFKAQSAAWMSWQSVPGQGLHQAVREHLIDMNKPLPNRLIKWIQKLFP